MTVSIVVFSGVKYFDGMPFYFFFEFFLFCAQGSAGFFYIPVVALEVVNDEMLFPDQLCLLKGASLINILDLYFWWPDFRR